MITKKSRWIKHAACTALSVIVLLIFPAKGYSQEDSGMDQLAQVMTDSLYYLQLTNDQSAQVTSIHRTAVKAFIDLNLKAESDTSIHGSKLFKEIVKINRQKEAGLTRILTPEQLKKYQDKKIERLADLQTRMMMTQLDLTESQIAQVYAINLAGTPDMLKDFHNIQDKEGKEKSAAKRSFEERVKEKDEAMKKILSIQQYEMFQAYKEDLRVVLKDSME